MSDLSLSLYDAALRTASRLRASHHNASRSTSPRYTAPRTATQRPYFTSPRRASLRYSSQRRTPQRNVPIQFYQRFAPLLVASLHRVSLRFTAPHTTTQRPHSILLRSAARCITTHRHAAHHNTTNPIQFYPAAACRTAALRSASHHRTSQRKDF